MVNYAAVKASNALISDKLPPGLVAVFTGATSGIGEYTLLAFAKHAVKPRVYFVGRSREAADRIVSECKAVNPDGEFIFLQADASLIKNIDRVCDEIKAKEEKIDLLVMSQGTLSLTGKTSEGLNYALALVYYGRARFAENLLPLLRRSTSVRRVLTIFAGGKDGPIDFDDFQGTKTFRSPIGIRNQRVSMITLHLEGLARMAPEVGFVHNYPGAVKSKIVRGWGPIEIFLGTLFALFGPFIFMPKEEVGERHLFMATSERYRGATKEGFVPLPNGVDIAMGTNGSKGSGVYVEDAKQEQSEQKSAQKALKKMRDDGAVEKLVARMRADFERITRNA